MYQIIKYAAEHGMNVLVQYKNDEDIIKIQVSKKDGVSSYAVDSIIYGIGSFTLEPNQIIFNRVVSMVEKLERSLG